MQIIWKLHDIMNNGPTYDNNMTSTSYHKAEKTKKYT